MQSWDISTMRVEPQRPEVLASDEEGRAIAINLPAGQGLDQHQVHERAWVMVASGAVQIEATGETVSGGPGLLVAFAPNERREIRATEDSRLLLLLSPWPGVGHPSAR
jgi:quercetin dioxygenase-like cupin family protein